MACLMPFVHAAVIASMWLSGSEYPYLALATTIVAVEMFLQVLWYGKIRYHYEGIHWWHFFWVPFGSLAVTVLDFHAAYLVLSGSQVNWKGRRYTVNTSKTIQPVMSKPLDPALDAPALDGKDKHKSFL
jgi:hypothetical protein